MVKPQASIALPQSSGTLMEEMPDRDGKVEDDKDGKVEEMPDRAQVETTGGCNTTTHQTTPQLPRMLHSMLKAIERLQCANYDPLLTLL